MTGPLSSSGSPLRDMQGGQLDSGLNMAATQWAIGKRCRTTLHNVSNLA